jgi:hypothetical protein
LRLHSRSAAEEKSRLKALQNKADKGVSIASLPVNINLFSRRTDSWITVVE